MVAMCSGRFLSRQDSRVYFRVQGFHPSIEHFRKAGVVADLGHRQARILQQLGSAAGRENGDAET